MANEFFLDEPSGEDLQWAQVARFLAGESSPEEAAATRAWLETDPARALAVAKLDTLLTPARVAGTPGVDVDAALHAVLSRIREESAAQAPRTIQSPPSTRRLAWRGLAARAAAILALIAGPILAFSLFTRTGPSLEQTVYTTEVGERESIRLADGTEVILGPQTELTLVAGYGNDTREVVLMGEAMFTVEHDEARPFLVQVPGGTVEDLGTAFTVRTGSAQGVRVVVTEGTVRLREAGAQVEEGVVLAAGDRGVLAAGAEPVAERGAATSDDLSWTRGVLAFRDASMTEVRSELRRWYGVELRFTDPGLAERHLNATFDGESVQQVVNVIALALGATVEIRGDTAVIAAPSNQ